MIGAARVAKAPPDGYQFVLGNVGTHAQNQTLYKNPLYNAATDFAPVGLLVDLPMLMVFAHDAAAQRSQGVHRLRQGEPGEDAVRLGRNRARRRHLACALLNVAMGVNITHIPYRGSALALQDMIAGRIDYQCLNASAAIPHIEGKTREGDHDDHQGAVGGVSGHPDRA